MIDPAAMLRAIRDSPDDDAPCMVYADWLLDRGDPRGELIHLQCQLDKRGARTRAQQLLDQHGERWGPFVDPRLWWAFERGFAAGVGHRGIFHCEDRQHGSWIRLFPDGTALYIVTSQGGTADVVARWFEVGQEYSSQLEYTLVEGDRCAHLALTGIEARVRTDERPPARLQLTGLLTPNALWIKNGNKERVHALEGEVADSRRPARPSTRMTRAVD